MPIQYVNGDLFEQDVDALAHGVNCVGVMGAGIAKQFRARYPKMYEEYRALCYDSNLHCGDIFTYKADDHYVFNLVTQQITGRDARIWAIKDALQQALRFCMFHNLTTIAMPYIGCGIGGLNWERDVHPVVKALSAKYPQITLVVCGL